MHIHGGPFKLIATDGVPVPAASQIEKDTVNVAPGERYDVIRPARAGEVAAALPHQSHVTNDNAQAQGGGGLTMVIHVTP